MTDRFLKPEQSLYHYLDSLLYHAAAETSDWQVQGRYLISADLWPLSEDGIVTVARPKKIIRPPIVVAFSLSDLPHQAPFAAYSADKTGSLNYLDENDMLGTRMPSSTEIRHAVGQSTYLEVVPPATATALQYIAKKLILC